MVHKDGKRIDARQFSGLHLFADQLKQVLVAFILLFPVTAGEFGLAKLRKCVRQIDPDRKRLLIVIYCLFEFTRALKYVAHARVCPV